MQFRYEIKNDLTYDVEFEVDDLFTNEDRYNSLDSSGVLIFGFLIDGAQWNLDKKCLVDSEKRFTPAPHILAKIFKVRILFFTKILN